MGSAGWRLTNGHRAAVCGLLLAGQPFVQVCKMIGVSPKRMKTYLPKDWANHKNPPRTKWSGDRLKALAADYRAHSLDVRTIIKRHGVTQGTLYKLAQAHGWPARPKGRRGKREQDPVRERLLKALQAATRRQKKRVSAASRGLPNAATSAPVGGRGPAPFLPTGSPALNSEASK